MKILLKLIITFISYFALIMFLLKIGHYDFICYIATLIITGIIIITNYLID